jgi:hypothetical protein
MWYSKNISLVLISNTVLGNVGRQTPEETFMPWSAHATQTWLEDDEDEGKTGNERKQKKGKEKKEKKEWAQIDFQRNKH